MKKISVLAAMAVAVSGSAALAGGYTPPVEQPVVVAPVTVAPVTTYSWSGFYAGAQVGRMSGTLKFPDATGIADTDVSANSYGIHAGYLHDFGRFVGGAELSYNKLNSIDVDGRDDTYSGHMTQGKLLAGYNAGRVLPYVSLGASRISVSDAGIDSASVKANGYFVGLGAKFAVTNNFLVGAEVQRHRYNDVKDLVAADDKIKLDATTFGLSASYKF